jgi:ribosome-binding factor A
MADAGRARKVADRIKTLIAANVESIVKDPDLGFITITDVRVTGDLQHASVFYTVFGDEAQRAKTAALLEQNKGRLRSFVGGQIQIRLTPSLDFFADAIPETAAHLEDLLREAKERDEAVAAAAAGATYAGESDPYRTPEPDDEADDDVDGAESDGAQDPGADARA